MRGSSLFVFAPLDALACGVGELLPAFLDAGQFVVHFGFEDGELSAVDADLGDELGDFVARLRDGLGGDGFEAGLGAGWHVVGPFRR